MADIVNTYNFTSVSGVQEGGEEPWSNPSYAGDTTSGTYASVTLVTNDDSWELQSKDNDAPGSGGDIIKVEIGITGYRSNTDTDFYVFIYPEYNGSAGDGFDSELGTTAETVWWDLANDTSLSKPDPWTWSDITTLNMLVWGLNLDQSTHSAYVDQLLLRITTSGISESVSDSFVYDDSASDTVCWGRPDEWHDAGPEREWTCEPTYEWFGSVLRDNNLQVTSAFVFDDSADCVTTLSGVLADTFVFDDSASAKVCRARLVEWHAEPEREWHCLPTDEWFGEMSLFEIYNITVTDTFVFGDSSDPVATISGVCEDEFVFQDDPGGSGFVWDLTADDSFVFDDQGLAAVNFTVYITDEFNFNAVCSGIATISGVAVDTFTFGDDALGGFIYTVSGTDSFVFGDEAIGGKVYTASGIDSFVFGDSVIAGQTFDETASDSFVFGDTATLEAIFNAIAQDSWVFQDRIVRVDVQFDFREDPRIPSSEFWNEVTTSSGGLWTEDGPPTSDGFSQSTQPTAGLWVESDKPETEGFGES